MKIIRQPKPQQPAQNQAPAGQPNRGQQHNEPVPQLERKVSDLEAMNIMKMVLGQTNEVDANIMESSVREQKKAELMEAHRINQRAIEEARRTGRITGHGQPNRPQQRPPVPVQPRQQPLQRPHMHQPQATPSPMNFMGDMMGDFLPEEDMLMDALPVFVGEETVEQGPKQMEFDFSNNKSSETLELILEKVTLILKQQETILTRINELEKARFRDTK